MQMLQIFILGTHIAAYDTDFTAAAIVALYRFLRSAHGFEPFSYITPGLRPANSGIPRARCQNATSNAYLQRIQNTARGNSIIPYLEGQL
jgi:hypothetical protein